MYKCENCGLLITPKYFSPMQQFFINNGRILRLWFIGHFTKLELVSILDTFGAEISAVLILSFHAFITGQLTWQAVLGMIGAAAWRSMYKGIRKLGSIYVDKFFDTTNNSIATPTTKEL